MPPKRLLLKLPEYPPFPPSLPPISSQFTPHFLPV